MTKKVFIKTLGCQMNVRDSEILLGMLQGQGYVPADNEREADVILFNTCSVREHAEARVWGKIGMLGKLSAAGPSSPSTEHRKPLIGIIGCMAQNYQAEIFRRMPQVNLVCGPANIYGIPELLERAEKGERQILAVDKKKRPLRVDYGIGGEIASAAFGGLAMTTGGKDCAITGKCKILDSPRNDQRLGTNRLKAFVSIMYGCDNFCSYCIVPYVRGREISRPVKHILEEVRYFAAQGVKEVTLLGQNVNSYGKDSRGKADFVALLEKVDKIQGIERIRFVTSHPKDASLELFKAMRGLPKVCEHLHLPLQSGSDKILRAMNRRYTLRQYRKLVDALRRIVPQGSVTTDIIVGFPGESAADFEKTYRAMHSIQFDEAFIFKYSPRQRTKAAGLKDDVVLEEKRERNQVLLRLQEEISLKKNQALIGNTMEVLVEGKGRCIGKNEQGEWLEGRSRANKVTLFPGGKDLIAKIVNVKVDKASLHTLTGELHGKED